MSFQDVRGEGFGGGVRRPGPGPVMGLAAGGQRSDEGTAAGVGGGGAYQGPANALLQYQQQVTLYEQLRRSLGGPRDTDELRLQLSTQESVVKVRTAHRGVEGHSRREIYYASQKMLVTAWF
jgi:hypothetical protein